MKCQRGACNQSAARSSSPCHVTRVCLHPLHAETMAVALRSPRCSVQSAGWCSGVLGTRRRMTARCMARAPTPPHAQPCCYKRVSSDSFQTPSRPAHRGSPLSLLRPPPPRSLPAPGLARGPACFRLLRPTVSARHSSVAPPVAHPSVRPIFRARRLAPGSNISSSQDGGQHDGRDQEEDAGDEAGEGERVRQGRPARAETQRTEDSLRAGLSLTDPVTIELYGAARQTIVMSIQLSLTQ